MQHSTLNFARNQADTSFLITELNPPPDYWNPNMRRANEKIFAAVTVLVLLSLLAILKLVLPSFAFNLVGSIDASVMLVVLSWALALHYLRDESTIGITGVTLVAFASAPVLLALVALLCVRFRSRSSLVFLLPFVADLVLIFSVVSLFAARKVAAFRARNSSADEEEPPELGFTYLGQAGGLPKRFRYEELKSGTNDFRNLIGRGGSGSVFKGFLDGLPVAVKRIDGEVHGEREFRSELNAILSVQHASLVRIFGYCLASGGQRFLVCEFLENGSLDAWIFPGAGGARELCCLSWALRYQVAVDVAKALAYLHDDCRSRILHLDVKPQNILLDANFRACVSDFGISRMMGKDESRVVTTIRGTRGYLAPEWFKGAGISEKSDVYSYGMVLLELVGGRRNWSYVDDDRGAISQRTWFYLLKFVSEKVREGKVMEAVDERLMKNVQQPEEAEVRVLVYVALWCIQERPELRPSMELVVSMLKGHVTVGVPPETRMFLVDEVFPVISETSSYSSRTQSSAGRSQYPGSYISQSFSVSTQMCR